MGELKMGKINCKKMTGPGTSSHSPALSQKHVRNVCLRYTGIWSNFILIVLRIQKK